MYFDRKAACRYLNRRHKLYKTLTNYVHGAIDTVSAKVQQTPNDGCQEEIHKVKSVFIQITSLLLNNDLDIFIFLETIKPIKHQISQLSKQFLSNVLIATEFQSGRKLAYVLKILNIFVDSVSTLRFNAILRAYIIEQYRADVKFNIEQCIFFTDLFLYGFYFTVRGFLERIFVQTESFIVDFIARIPAFTQWSPFIPKKYLFKLKNQSQNWINNLIKDTKSQYQELQALQNRIKEIIVEEKNHKNETEKQQSQRETLDKQYIELYEKYELTRSKLEYIERSQGLQIAKELQEVIEQCQFFDPMFRLPTLLYNLYFSRSLSLLVIERIKPSQMLSLYDDEAFISQLRQCSSLQKAVDLSTYFVANLSTQRNRQQLIEFVIDNCHYDGNLDLIMKVITQINCIYPEIGDYLTKKAYKIASQIKMNKKYLNLICESIKYHLIPSQIILSYIEKRLQSQHTEMSPHEIIRQSCMILELLGQGIYHQSLETNIEINRLLEMIEERIIEKKLGTELLFNLKCVKNYLRKAHCLTDCMNGNDAIKDTETLTQLAGEYNLNQHFDFILKRIMQLLHTKSPNNKTEETYNKKRIVNYIVNSIENQTNFIQTFLQASLVKEINHKDIKGEILQKTIKKIQIHILNDIQQAIKWSRFLGELYNYEITSRKQLSTILQTKLLYSHELSQLRTFQLMVKCVIECLNTSKFYIIESEMAKEANQYIVNFLIKFKRSMLKYLEAKERKGRFENVIIEHEVGELMQSFHPVLLNKFNSVDEIDLWIQKVKFSSPKDTLLSVNLYKILNSYQQVDKNSQFDPTLQDKSIKSNHKKQKTNQKPNKKTIYKQKTPVSSQPQIQSKPISYVLKNPLTSIQSFKKQIEQINENFRNEQIEEMTEQLKLLIKEEQYQVESSLKEMMGITPQIELEDKFPELNQRNLKSFKKSKQVQSTLFNMRKILKNSHGKKMKIIARKANIPNIELDQVKI